jgi:hypothetical protein
MKLGTAALTLFLLAATPSLARAQEDDRPRPPAPPGAPGMPGPHMGPHMGPPGTPGPDGDPERRKELRRRISALRMARLTQELDLDEATAAKLFPAINHQDERSAQIAEEHTKQMHKLDELCHKPDTKDADVAPVIDALFATRKQMRDVEDELHAKVRGILTPSQMAKFILFHEHFGDEVREMLHGDEMHGESPRQHEEMAKARAAFAIAAKQKLGALRAQAKMMREKAAIAEKEGAASPAELEKIRAEADQMDAEAARIELELHRAHGEPSPAPAPQPPEKPKMMR